MITMIATIVIVMVIMMTVMMTTIMRIVTIMSDVMGQRMLVAPACATWLVVCMYKDTPPQTRS